MQRRISRGVIHATYTLDQEQGDRTSLACLPSVHRLSGFGGLGVTFIQEGEPLTQIVGRAFDANGNRTATDVQIGNSAPDYRMGLVNGVTYGPLRLNMVLDYQRAATSSTSRNSSTTTPGSRPTTARTHGRTG